MGPQGIQGEPGSPGSPTGGTTGQLLTKKSNADFDLEWKDLTSSVLVDSTSAGVSILTAPDRVTQRETMEAANRHASLRDDFARYPDGTSFTHLSQAPDFGGTTNWRLTTGSGGVSGHPAVKNDPILGRGLIGQGNGLYYMANSLSVPIRSLAMELSLKSTGTTGFHNGLTFGFGPSDLVKVGNNIGLQLGMIHFSIGRGGIGNSITNHPSASFDSLIPDGETSANQPWFRDSSISGLAMNVRYTLRITFEGNSMVFTMNGKTWRWRDPRISPTQFYSFFFETAGPTSHEDVWIIHRVTVNDDSQMSEIDGHRGDLPGVLAKSATLNWPAKQRHSLTGEAGSFIYGGIPANAAHAVADYYYSEKGLLVRPWGIDYGDYSITLGRYASDRIESPVGADKVWQQVTPHFLQNDGDWFESTIALECPNSNRKQLKFRTTGGAIPELTMPEFTDQGLGVLRIMQCRAPNTRNFVQIELEVVTNSEAGMVKKWIRRYRGNDGLGNSAVRIIHTGTAIGDTVINGSIDKMHVRKR